MIVAGIGFRKAATRASLLDALTRAAQGQAVAALAAPDDLADSDCLKALAQSLFLPIVGVSAAAIRAAETLTRSPRVQIERGTGSVAEACAIAASGGRLLGPRVVSADRMATAALAESPLQ